MLQGHLLHAADILFSQLSADARLKKQITQRSDQQTDISMGTAKTNRPHKSTYQPWDQPPPPQKA